MSTPKKRQDYWRRRAQAKALYARGSALAVDRMDEPKLHGLLAAALVHLEMDLRDAARPDLLAAAQDANAIASELRIRGRQLGFDYSMGGSTGRS